MNEAERKDYWKNKTGKENPDLSDLGTTEGYYYSDDLRAFEQLRIR